MSEIYNKLNSLKNRLNDLELTVTQEVKKEETQHIYKARMEKKLPLIKEMQNSKVSINAGQEATFTTSRFTIQSFPYSLSLKEDVKTLREDEEVFVDSSESLFSAILDMIRVLAENPALEAQKKLVIACHPDALRNHATEFFGEDTENVFKRFEFIYNPVWVKREVKHKPRQDPNKWPKDACIQCYSCGSQNEGSHWKKRCSYDRANDSYCIDYYIATCMTCDPGNTLTY